jgi:anti-sigma regulatory factor (Ser/Thr protein kinase)
MNPGQGRRGLRVWLAARVAAGSTRGAPFLHPTRRAHAAEVPWPPAPGAQREENTQLPAAARRFVADALWRFGVDSEAISTASLLTSELVTNSVVHARSPVRVVVGVKGRALHIAVTDDEPGDVQPRAIDPERPNGRGLLLVSRLATTWSVEPVPGGKTVCFELVIRQ